MQTRHILLSGLLHILRMYDYFTNDSFSYKSSSTIEKLKEAIAYMDKHLENKIINQNGTDEIILKCAVFVN
jgi:hypothetical protein